jgi:hypothetical protein
MQGSKTASGRGKVFSVSIADRNAHLRRAICDLAERCPRLTRDCYWAGTSAIALEELAHRESFDLDFHTVEALVDTRPVLAEIERAFPGGLELLDAPDSHGSGFGGVLEVTPGVKVTLQVFGGFESVRDSDLVPSTTAPALRRITLRRYLADKVQCVLERIEGRDLVDIAAVLRHDPGMVRALGRAVRAQDALLMAERLLGWSDAALRDDLRAYPDVDPSDALSMRDQLLGMLRSDSEQ